MSSGSVFSGTLQTITSTKLEELSKQRAKFSKQHAALLTSAEAEQNPMKRLSIVVDGTKLCLGVKTTAHKDDDSRPGRVISGGTRNSRLETDLKNVDRFLDQAHFDPSVSNDVLEDWEKKLLQYVSVQAAKFQYADLYGRLVTEWLSSEKSATADGDIEMDESFEELPSTEKLEARREWEKSVFEPATVDLPALEAYLERLFVTEKNSVASSLNDLRKKVRDFETSLSSSSHFNTYTLRWVIKSLQNSDLLSNEKREVLGDFLNNNVILTEIADVLNMRLEALDSWNWGDHILLEQQRQINGQFQIHMHEDVLQAIFLHYIGVKWSVFFKASFLALRNNSQTWQNNRTDIAKADRMRRGFFLGDRGQKFRGNLDGKRSKIQRKRYFANQLLDYEQQQMQHNEGEEEADFADFVEERPRKRSKQLARKSAPAPTQATFASSAPAQFQGEELECDAEGLSVLEGLDDSEPESNDEVDESDKNPMEAKQGLLHVLATEIIVNTQLNGELACFRTVFESWNPLLPHETVLTILEFFRVSAKWRKFFKSFLQAPLKFADDDQSTEPRLRRRGVPGSHALSDVFGEVVLFCLDFSVNQNTNGALLHRLYDDVWFWNKNYETCALAWKNVLEFAEVTGTQINDAKSGSIHIGRDGKMKLNEDLPQGDIRWGFLYLNPSNGRFDIDRRMVDSHVGELRKQLQGKSKSVIDWIQAWNSYAATFFSSNFGKAANCFGREHIDTMLATHRHIQESIFDGSNVVQHLKRMIEDRFGVSDLPDGFLYFPVELGGLDLKSPFVGLLQIRDSVKTNPYDFLNEYVENEKDDYIEAKRRFDRGDLEHMRWKTDKPDFRPDDAETFFSMEEFVRYREQLASVGKANLRTVYLELLKCPEEKPVDPTSQVNQALQELRAPSNLGSITSSWYSMNAYWKWIAQMYGPDMIARFGGLNVVDPGWLPIGLVGQFRQKRTKWQG
ncbi:Glucosylceramidase [Ascochyta lentis]